MGKKVTFGTKPNPQTTRASSPRSFCFGWGISGAPAWSTWRASGSGPPWRSFSTAAFAVRGDNALCDAANLGGVAPWIPGRAVDGGRDA